MDDNTILEVEGLEFSYAGARTLKGVSFRLEKGSVICIIGANGAGKTTTLRILSGLEKAGSGRVLVGGVPIDGLSPKAILRLGVSHVPEQGRLFNDMTVYENLLMGAYICKDRKTLAEQLHLVYAYFPRLYERSRQRAGSLSGGERQMLAVGRALMSKPRVLLMDEPSSGLAPQLVEMVGQLVLDINQKGISVVLVEQNAEMALNVARYGYVLERGRVSFEGKAEDLINNDMVKQAYLGI